jgi:DNA-binding NarL/FixJ family response regulator
MSWTANRQIRVALLDHQAIVRYGAAKRLAEEPDFVFIGSADSSVELPSLLGQSLCDVLIADYTLGRQDVDGIHLIRFIRHRYPAVRILIWSSSETIGLAALALRAGALGFISKAQDLDDIVTAVRMVAAGHVCVSRDMEIELSQRKMGRGVLQAEQSENDIPGSHNLTFALSPKEREVLRCYLGGMSVSEVATKFKRSIKTISTQKSSACRKLGVRTDAELFMLNREVGGL